MRKWKMPKWMVPYAANITNTGREPTVEAIEFMYNDDASPLINLPLSTLEACVKSQVGLLYRLHEKKLL